MDQKVVTVDLIIDLSIDNCFICRGFLLRYTYFICCCCCCWSDRLIQNHKCMFLYVCGFLKYRFFSFSSSNVSVPYHIKNGHTIRIISVERHESVSVCVRVVSKSNTLKQIKSDPKRSYKYF